jgi:hypothetical protein
MKKNEFNGINMLYHYFIFLHPDNFDSSITHPRNYSFLNYNRLMQYFEIDEIMKVFHDANRTYKIVLPAETGKTGGGGSKSDASELATVFGKGGKNPRKRRKSKSKKRGRKVRTRKN